MSILLATRRFLVVDKPPGLAVHPGPRTPDSLEPLLPALAPGRPPPHPVHRLDRDTSGCLLLARDKAALRLLAADFAEGRIGKSYRAILVHPPDAEAGMIDVPLAKVSSAKDGWRMVPSSAGKPARTGWRILARHAGLALVAFTPQTGRTHQLRVHAGQMAPGAAIVGDPVYGDAHPAGMMLHAFSLQVPDYWPDGGAATRPPHAKTAEAPCPGRFRALGLGWEG